MQPKADKYSYRIVWSEEDKVHVARCLEFPSLAAHAESADLALKEIGDVVQGVLDWMQKDGEKMPEPLGLKKFRGQVSLRMPPEVHRNLSIKSSEEGVSLNQYILSKICIA